ncbi:extracellular solute-binding protein [Endozoicomonas sp. Mp262]|uniref:extracellular solute-binding protein n=1 Tax=Endozoicomonas sp. Mp262 TaxID=2919499 RepID=UPI0021E0B735
MANIKTLLFASAILALFSFASAARPAEQATKVHIRYSLSLIGDAAYSDNFQHFDYVNPDAPKGGTLKLAAIGTFDTLNSYNTKGRAASGLYTIHDRLMTRSADEPYTLYPLIAKSFEHPDDYGWVAFNMNPLARFDDRRPITSEDVVFTFKMLQESGSPFIKNILRDVISVSNPSPDKVIFHLGPGRGIKVMAYLAFIPVMPKHYWQGRSFSTGLTTPPVSSGPMRVKELQLGRSITYEKVKNYWAENLPVRKGLFNFDQIKIDYYRDSHAAMEAFRAGLYNFRYEFDTKTWYESYDFRAVQKGEVIKENVPNLHPPGMSSLVFNTRIPLFKNRPVRKALLQVFDFEWINNYLLHSNETRTTSFFSNTPLMATGLPSPGELKLLVPYKSQLPPELFTLPPSLPVSDGNGNSRNHKKTAIQLLKQAGWHLDKGKMRHRETNQLFSFTLLLDSPGAERVTQPFKKSLADIGITMNIQTLDVSQYRKRIKEFNFEMASWHFIHSPFPGSEQTNNWSSSAAKEPGSNNLAGVNQPIVDKLVKQLREASTYDEIIDVTKALDRVLLWNYYVIPRWHDNQNHIAYWHDLDRPRTGNPHYHVLEAMWHK